MSTPAFVLPLGNNTITSFGAKEGDLLIAYNPQNQKIVFAVIGDRGPSDKLGEGSVILNMLLEDKKEFPKTREDTYKLEANKNTIICIIPDTNLYEMERPYTQKNIRERILKWLAKQNINNEQEIINFIEKNKPIIIN